MKASTILSSILAAGCLFCTATAATNDGSAEKRLGIVPDLENAINRLVGIAAAIEDGIAPQDLSSVRDGERARRTFDHAFYCYELRNIHGARVAVTYLRRWGVAGCGTCAGHWQVRDGRKIVAEA